MPLIETKGAASAQGFGLTIGGAQPVYIEDVFSTWLYKGNSSTQTITNGIDLSGKGGMVWTKDRTTPDYNLLFDTARGATNYLVSDGTFAQNSIATSLTAFNSNGFSIGSLSSLNLNNDNFVSWTFRKQPKFFDIVTYTGNGVADRSVSHNLGSVPGCIIVKCTSYGPTDWAVYHRSLTGGNELQLNSSNAQTTAQQYFGTPTSTTFVLKATGNDTNSNGKTYVAYLFAHDAGGFGLTGTDNVISCGSLTTDGSGNFSVNLGYEPQWVLVKPINVADSWILWDTMRGWPARNSTSVNYVTGRVLYPNLTNGETNYNGPYVNSATGFGGVLMSSVTYIYIAIRRGPMKVPTSGTSVFSPVRQAGGGTVTTNFVVDASITKDIAVSVIGDNFVWDRLRGSANGSLAARNLITNSTAAESAGSLSAAVMNVSNTAVTDSFYGSGYNVIYWNFRRAPGFFDVVCYTGTGSATTQAHNLGVAPELLIVKSRNTGATRWCVGSSALGGWGSALFINTNAAVDIFSGIQFNSTAPTSTVFTVGSGGETNVSAYTYVAYLFASCPGVSKVGSYTGTGALQTVNCGFTGGARFVLIKRTDSTGDWYVYDSARGISSGNDPYLFLNSLSAEVTNTNYVDTTSVGFQVTAAAPAGLNANGGTYIFLAIA